MSFLDIVYVITIIFAVCYLGYLLYVFATRKWAAKIITVSELKENRIKGQLIDVRESDEFESRHILGSRNIPHTQMKQRLAEIRKDQPIYLYDQVGMLVGRSAAILKRAGYKDIYILKGGFEAWDGKIKEKKKH